jgi:AcrR family transcriptional regulator
MAKTTPTTREPLTRQRVLDAAIELVDREGLDALSMRKLGTRLGVEAMSLYKHVANKDAVLDGLVEHLWNDVHNAITQHDSWDARLRSYAHAVRGTMHKHPQPATLLLSRCMLPTQLLEIYATLIESLREAGFDEATSARTVRAMSGFVLGYVSAELYCLGVWRSGQGAPEVASADAATSAASSTNALLWLGRILPPGTPSRLVNAALSMIDCDLNEDFDTSLDLAISGLRQLLEENGSSGRTA